MKIESYFKEAYSILGDVLEDKVLLDTLNKVVQLCITAFKNKNAVYFCGNGGSAGQAEHIAAEFTSKFKLHRAPLNAEALGTNFSAITAIANDFGYDQVFSRLFEAKAKKGDLLIALSTSGKSKNIHSVLVKAKTLGITSVGLTGHIPNPMVDICDHVISVPSKNVARIQEIHLLIGHVICETVESEIFTSDE